VKRKNCNYATVPDLKTLTPDPAGEKAGRLKHIVALITKKITQPQIITLTEVMLQENM